MRHFLCVYRRLIGGVPCVYNRSVFARVCCYTVTRLDRQAMATVVKSPNDKKLYRVITLENGLTALLISDPPKSAGVESAELKQHEVTVTDVTTNDTLQTETQPRANGTCVVPGGMLPECTGVVSSAVDVNESGAAASDDGDSSWTDVSSDSASSVDCDLTPTSANDAEFSKVEHPNRPIAKPCHQRSRSQQGKAVCTGDKLSAAALCVGVGSFCDPADIPGLAHFLEHMVFMGSKKYPHENDFDNYVSEHGGSSNAFTECEQTIFHFDVQRQFFGLALDRFAQFFIHPLMSKDSVDREIESVDSEFRMSLPSDTYRIEALLGSLVNNNHPMSKFMWGNIETLKRRPAARKVDIYKRLQNFRSQFYVAQLMTLAVQSQDSLDQLESLVRSIFYAVPSSSLSKITFKDLPPPFNNSSFRRLYKGLSHIVFQLNYYSHIITSINNILLLIVPVKTLNEVVLTWPLPTQLHNYRVKPLHYLGWLAGHEGKGSLLAYLKQRHWAVSIESGNSESGMEQNSNSSWFQVVVTLSHDGFLHVNEVITCVFQYLLLLQTVGPQRHIFTEIKTIDDNEFYFQESDEAQDYVESLCANMQLYPPEHYITGDALMLDYDEQVIRSCTDLLTADRVNVIILSNDYSLLAGYCNQTEKWYKTPYHVEDIPADWLSQWLNPGVNNDLQLPASNQYIAKHFELKAADVADSQYPVVVRESAVSRLWYKKDSIFNVPRAYVHFHLTIPAITKTARSLSLCELYVRLLLHSLSECFYDAELAELSYDVKSVGNGLVLKFGGFSDKLPLLFYGVVDAIAEFSVTNKQFEVVKKDFETVYLNLSMRPEKLNRDIRLSLLEDNHWTLCEKHAELCSVDLQELTCFSQNLYKFVYVEGLIQGNMTSKEAIELENYLLTKLQLKPLMTDDNSQICVCQLPADVPVVFKVKNRNTQDDNCVITNYYQHGPANIHEYSLMDLLLTYLDEPCFDYLRTRKQLGYQVNCGVRCTHGILGYTVMVCSQSHKYSMKYLDEQIETFLGQQSRQVDKIKAKKFHRLVKSLVTLKCIDDLNLIEEVSRNWIEIVDKTYLFDRRYREIEELHKLTLDEFKNWSTGHLLPGLHRRKLTVQVLGNKTLKTYKKNGLTSHKKSVVGGRSYKFASRQQQNKDSVASVGCVTTDTLKSLSTPSLVDLTATTATTATTTTTTGVNGPMCDSVETRLQAAAAASSDMTISSVVSLTTPVTEDASCDETDDRHSAVSVLSVDVVQRSAVSQLIYVDDVTAFRQKRSFYPPSKILP